MLVGDPDYFAERIQRYKDMGVDEIILRFDGDHAQIKRSIELVGKYVIPKFKNPMMVLRENPLAGPVP